MPASSLRNPRRTGGTAAPLLIGVALVSLFMVVTASLKQSIADAAAEQFAGDLLIIGEVALAPTWPLRSPPSPR